MKTKTFLLICLLLGFSMTQLSAQTLKKGAVIAIRNYTFTLQPDVTMNQCLDFWTNKHIPAWEKNYPGTRLFLLSGDRGEKKNQFAEILYFESLEVRNKYWPIADDTTATDFDKAAAVKMKVITDEWSKYVSTGTSVYTDWVIK